MLKQQVRSLGSLVFTCSMLAVLTGCVMHGIPNPRPLKVGVAADLSASQPVKVVNAQASSEVITIGRVGFGKMMGNLHEWTESAVTLLKSELTKRSVTVADDGTKILKLTITSVKLSSRPMGSACTAKIKVETGDGTTVLLDGHAASSQPPRACDAAVAAAVEALLTDKTVQAYLCK